MPSYFGVLLVFVLSYTLPRTCYTISLNDEQKHIPRSNVFGIVGSSPAKIAKYPYTVSVSFDGSLLGSGAIVNKHWIVCSASQLESYEHANLTIRAGSDYIESGGQVFYTDKIYINQDYTGDFPYNVAVIKLNRALQINANAMPVKLASSPPKAGCNGVITGWGKQAVAADDSDRLQVARVTVKPAAECQASHPTVDVTKVICADADGVGPCYGDKGDPLVCGRKLIGHFIGGNECNLLQVLELYSNISLYRRWIMRTINNNSDGIDDE